MRAKLETLMFYLEEWLVVATKDQSIKVLPLAGMEEWRKSSRKKGAVVHLPSSGVLQKEEKM